MELRNYFLILRKSWILILSTLFVMVSISAVWSFTRTPLYQAKTQLFVSVRTGEASAGDLSQGSSFARQAVVSYVSVVNSTIVMDRVIDTLQLSETSEDLMERVSAKSPANTVLIDLKVTDPDPARSAEIANTTSAVFADVVSNELEAPTEGSPARVRVDIIRPATVPASPVSPNLMKNLLLGVLGGLGIGIGLAILREVLDTKVRSKEDIEAVTGLPIVGMIGHDPESTTQPLVVLKDPRNPLAEAFRALRTNLSYLNVEDGPNTLVITSAGPGEGNTTTVVNLAVAMADSGARVALIDADLRKPSVAKVLGIEGGVGLSDLLAGNASFDDVLQHFGRHELFVLPAGRIPPNPSELLGSTAMGKVLDMLSERFDYVIVDTPPVLAVTDSTILSTRVGGTLMIAAANKVRKQELSNALGALETVEGKVLGVVVTMVPTKGPGAYSYSSYSYRYYGSSSKDSEDAKSEPEVNLSVISS